MLNILNGEFLSRGTWVTPARCQYLVVIGANDTFLATDVVLADAATCHLFAVFSDGAEERATARWNISHRSKSIFHRSIERQCRWNVRDKKKTIAFSSSNRQTRMVFDRPYVCILDVPRWFSASPSSQACTCRTSDHPRQVCTRIVRSPGCRCQKHCLTCCSCTNSGNLRRSVRVPPFCRPGSSRATSPNTSRLASLALDNQ